MSKVIPAEIKKILPKEGQELFLSAYNESHLKGNTDSASTELAWHVVKSKFKKEEDGRWVARGVDFITPSYFVFALDSPEQDIIMRAEGDEVILDAILTTSSPDSDGLVISESELQVIADQINAEGSTLPDEDHTVLRAISNTFAGADVGVIKKALQKKKGVFKNIKAAVKDGKLWIKAVLDNSYKSLITKYKKLSIEVMGKKVDNKLSNPTYLGFTFTNNPKIQGAELF